MHHLLLPTILQTPDQSLAYLFFRLRLLSTPVDPLFLLGSNSSPSLSHPPGPRTVAALPPSSRNLSLSLSLSFSFSLIFSLFRFSPFLSSTPALALAPAPDRVLAPELFSRPFLLDTLLSRSSRGGGVGLSLGLLPSLSPRPALTLAPSRGLLLREILLALLLRLRLRLRSRPLSRSERDSYSSL